VTISGHHLFQTGQGVTEAGHWSCETGQLVIETEMRLVIKKDKILKKISNMVTKNWSLVI
jgi:hypothetical protein